MMSPYDALGILGVAMSVYSYARVQWRRDYAKCFTYSMLNLLGATLLTISLMHNWNLAAFVSNSCWWLISLYGVYRCLKYEWRARQAAVKIVE